MFSVCLVIMQSKENPLGPGQVYVLRDYAAKAYVFDSLPELIKAFQTYYMRIVKIFSTVITAKLDDVDCYISTCTRVMSFTDPRLYETTQRQLNRYRDDVLGYYTSATSQIPQHLDNFIKSQRTWTVKIMNKWIQTIGDGILELNWDIKLNRDQNMKKSMFFFPMDAISVITINHF